MKFLQVFNLILISLTIRANAIVITCDFMNKNPLESTFYTCENRPIPIQMISKCNRRIEWILGSHMQGKSHDDVKFLNVVDQVLNYFPQNFDYFFKNLEIIQIHTTKLKEITSEDLKPFKKLKNLWIPGNEVEILEGDLFVNNPLLEFIAIQENHIMHIDQSTFAVLKKLKHLMFFEIYCLSGVSYDYLNLEEALKDILSNCSNFAFVMRRFHEMRNEVATC